MAPASFCNVFRAELAPNASSPARGCASGSCHAKAEGQNGFQLSIFSYDPRADHRVIVHNAGVTRDRTLGKMREQSWDLTLDVNLGAILRLNEALLPALGAGGRVILLASIAGLAGNVGQTNYAASKAAVAGLARHLGPALAPRGIAVNAIAPGFIETRMTAAIPAATREVARRLSNLSQGGLPEDVAAAITFLCSPGAAGLSGRVLRVCGGNLIGA